MTRASASQAHLATLAAAAHKEDLDALEAEKLKEDEKSIPRHSTSKRTKKEEVTEARLTVRIAEVVRSHISLDQEQILLQCDVRSPS